MKGVWVRKKKQSSTLTDIGYTAENPAGLVIGTCISALVEKQCCTVSLLICNEIYISDQYCEILEDSIW